MLTYRELLFNLQLLTPEQLDMHVSIYNGLNDEYYELRGIKVTEESDVLDEGHPYLTIKE